MKLGMLVRVVFDDHCKLEGICDDSALSCEVVGRITAISKKCFTVRTWGNPENLIHDGNSEGFVILRSTITSLQTLRPISHGAPRGGSKARIRR